MRAFLLRPPLLAVVLLAVAGCGAAAQPSGGHGEAATSLVENVDKLGRQQERDEKAMTQIQKGAQHCQVTTKDLVQCQNSLSRSQNRLVNCYGGKKASSRVGGGIEINRLLAPQGDSFTCQYISQKKALSLFAE